MPSPKVIVTVLREGRSVQVAHTSMCVSNATEIMVGCSALFVPQRDQPQPHPKQSHNLPTPINADRLRNFLVGYTPSTVEFLYAGFAKGFPLHFEGEFLTFEAENLLSARDRPDVVFSKIKKETEALRQGQECPRFSCYIIILTTLSSKGRSVIHTSVIVFA